MPQCPVCQNECGKNPTVPCSTCGWNLSLYCWEGGTWKILSYAQNFKDFKDAESWAKKKWEELQSKESKLSKLQTEINELTQNRSPLPSHGTTAEKPTGEAMPQRADEYETLRQQEREERRRLMSLLQKADEERRQLQSLSGDQISKLQADLQKSHKERSFLHSQIKQLNNQFITLENRLTELEQNFKANSPYNSPYPVDAPTETASPTFHPDTQTSVTQFQPAPTNQQLSLQEANLVDNYNHNPDSLSNHYRSVSVTQDNIQQRRLDNSKALILQPTRRGNYWILNDGNLNYYMVPKANLKINEYNYATLEALFECQEYKSEYSDKFQLIKPARVSPVSGGENWQLVEAGVLQFESS